MSEKRAGRRLRSRHYHQTLRYDVTEPSVQRALLRVLPEVSFLAAARSCSTKSWARERPPGPRPLRSDKFPRGLPDLQGSDLQRVQVDNEASDFALALQQWGDEYGLGCLRENPLNSLHWKDPVECSLWSDGSWNGTVYDACVFMGAERELRNCVATYPNSLCYHHCVVGTFILLRMVTHFLRVPYVC